MRGAQNNGYAWLLAAGLILAAGSISGCIDESSTSADGGVTDQTGNVVDLDHVPDRIITLTPALTGIVVDLGAGSSIIGADSISVAENPDLDMETVSTYDSFDSEKLVEIAPDLVLMDRTLDITDSNYNTITRLSIPVYRAFPGDFADVVDLISDIGELLGRTDVSDPLTDDMEKRYRTVTDEVSDVPEEERPNVLYVTYYDGTADPWVGTSSTFSADLIGSAGGIPLIDDDTGIVVQVPVETVIDADPDVIITTQSSSWPTPSRDTILSDPAWSSVDAVKNGRVHDIDGDLLDRTGPNLIEGFEMVHEVLYP